MHFFKVYVILYMNMFAWKGNGASNCYDDHGSCFFNHLFLQ